jgi:hypothetical protein
MPIAKTRKKMTAKTFAKEMDVDYTTVLRWLRLGLVPGATLKEDDRGNYWEIPRSALKMGRPKAGRKRRKGSAGDNAG